MIKAVAFDAFGTICNVPEKRAFVNWVRRNNHGKIRELLGRHMMGMAEHEFDDAFYADMHIEQASFYEYDDFQSAYDYCRSQGYKIGLISNLSIQYGEMIHKQFAERMDCLCLSYELGCIKPDKAIYQAFCDSLNVNPDQVIMIGDNLIADVQGPRDFGMQAVHLDRSGIAQGAITNLHIKLDTLNS